MPTHGNDTVHGAAGNHDIFGLGGDDTFYWKTGNGNDTLHGGETGENYDANVYFDKTGGDRLVIASNASVQLRFTTSEDGWFRDTASGEKVIFSGMERLEMTGRGNDIIDGRNAKLEAAHHGTPVHGLTVYAGAGHDLIYGTNGEDFLDGGSGNDTIYGGNGWDFIQSSTGHDLIYGGGGNDNIRWGQGNPDEIIGNDTIWGGETQEDGGDLLNIWVRGYDGTGVNVRFATAESGTAWTDIGGARSTLRFHEFENFFTHEGNDTVTGANATIGANKAGMHFNTRWGNDRLTGTSGNDRLEGGPGRDTIEGGRGNDLISASESIHMVGAPGDGDADVLVFRSGFGHDTVRGFDVGLDRLQIHDNMTYTARETGGGTLLTFNTGDTIFIETLDFI